MVNVTVMRHIKFAADEIHVVLHKPLTLSWNVDLLILRNTHFLRESLSI